MTTDSDRKKLVRARMRETGENYTTARAALGLGRVVVEQQGPRPGTTDPRATEVDGGSPRRALDAAHLRHPEVAAAARTAVLRRVAPDGRLADIPARRRTRTQVLLELTLLFDRRREYPEREVNELLGAAHPDVASLRRYLVEYGYLTREASVYRLCEVLPSRDANQSQEVPEHERELLLAHGVGE